MAGSGRDDALARHAIELGYVSKAQVEQVRRERRALLESGRDALPLMEMLVDAGHLTPDRARLVEQMGGTEASSGTGKQRAAGASGTRARAHHGGASGQHRRARSPGGTGHAHAVSRRPPPLTVSQKAILAGGGVSGFIGVVLIFIALTRSATPEPLAGDLSGPSPAIPGDLVRVDVPSPDDSPVIAADAGDPAAGVAANAGSDSPGARTPDATGDAAAPKAPPVPGAAVEYKGHHYLVIETGMNWDAARTHCESLGGHLVTITDKDEFAFVRKLCTGNRSFLIGLSDIEEEGTWRWVTGEKVSFTGWAKGQPDNWKDMEDVAVLMQYNPRPWNDVSPETNGAFICEWDR